MNTFLQKMKSEIFLGGEGRVRGDVTTFFSKYPENGSFECTEKKGWQQKTQMPKIHQRPILIVLSQILQLLKV